ncbi:threonine synthase [[Candida] anglica]|uniref:threonine synthase n=1 Tax=[Candida] anglica TaxID=148631 RepID=A0ABP0EAC0_9ASCO
MSQAYRSTRSSGPQALTFEEAVMKGLAQDGGLFVPSEIPQLPANFIEEWKDLSFQELAFNILRLYINPEEISDSDLRRLVQVSYSTFRHKDVTPLQPIDKEKDLYLLELFHGPTYAFKDVALQFVGNLFEYFLTRRNADVADDKRETITVVGATSGDTGSAAIYGLRGKKDVSVFILYPTGRISPIQEEQMTTVEDKNVHTLSVKGTFDDCQDIVKQIFGDADFNSKHHVGAVNSINWARILAQMTYYFYSYFQLVKQTGNSKVRFVVPSGNFGDILAGYYAKKMGLPVDRLIIATNENDILDRFMKSGRYEKAAGNPAAAEVKATYSPAMDILISSNFERLLWYLVRDNLASGDDEKAGQILNDWMVQLKTTGSVVAPEEVVKAARVDFDSERVDDKDTAATIKSVYQAHPDKYVLDPHSAVGVATSYRNIDRDAASGEKDVQYISLSTAHPAKFADVVNQSLAGIDGYSFDKDVLPEELRALATKEKRIRLIDEASLEKVKAAIEEELAKE